MTEIHVDDEVGGHSTGELLPEQAEALRPHVLGRHVHDLGAGRGLLAARLVGLGARHVTMVDPCYPVTFRADRLTMVGAYPHDYEPRESMEVAFLSWPPYLWCAPPEVVRALPRLLATAPVVAYLGSNFGRLCGNPELWQHLATREVLTYVPNERNSLIVYGRTGARLGQDMLPEEKAALYRGAIPQPVYGVTYG